MRKILILFSIFVPLLLTNCNKDQRFDPNRPLTAEEKRKKNIKEGKGATLGGLLNSARGTNYEFSSSNPMWRASLEILDFLPLTTVDYSGGVIITDWYSDNTDKEQIKLTIRFLSNEISSSSLKIIVHNKKCDANQNCRIVLSKSNLIESELRSTILRKASLLQKSDKEKK